MKLTFLGTGTSQGIPVIGCDCAVCCSNNPRDKRLRTSVHIENGNDSLVIDCGPDFRQQMLRAEIQRVNAVLLTHEHNDHIIGLDDVRPYNFMQRSDLPVYGLPRVLESVKDRFAYIFESNPYPGSPRLELKPIDFDTEFEVGKTTIRSIRVDHGGMDILGFQCGGLAYITDAKRLSDDTMQQIEQCEVLVLNALREKPHHSHLTLQEAIDLADRIGAHSAYFTHISHYLGGHDAVSNGLPSNMYLAYDGCEVMCSY